MRKAFVFYLLLIFIWGCGTDSKPEATSGNLSPESISLKWKNVSDDPLRPENEVYLVVNKEEERIGLISSCEKIFRHEFSDFSIPEDALDACGGWWAGNPDYFYVQRNANGEYWVFRSKLEENKTFNYEPVLWISARGEWRSIYDLSLVPGVYTKSASNKSWVMVIEETEGKYAVGYTNWEGMLPNRRRLPEVYQEHNPRLLEKFDLNPFFLTFESDLGKGYFIIEDNEVEVTFLEQFILPDSVLVMNHE